MHGHFICMCMFWPFIVVVVVIAIPQMQRRHHQTRQVYSVRGCSM